MSLRLASLVRNQAYGLTRPCQNISDTCLRRVTVVVIINLELCLIIRQAYVFGIKRRGPEIH